MVDRSRSIEFVVTDSEVEALILENVLIKKYKPKYNSKFVDDKTYAYVKIDKVHSSDGEYVPLPTVTVVRGKPSDDADYFGPYPDTLTVKRLLRRLRRVFPYCTAKMHVIVPSSRDAKFIAKSNRPCFQYQIGLCNGICAGLVTRAEHEANLRQIKRFFSGEKVELKSELERMMRQLAKDHEYEAAARIRNTLYAIQYVGSNLHLPHTIDEVSIVAEKKEKKLRAQTDLIERLQFPKQVMKEHDGFKIECYDISNIQGKFAVGSMVVAVDGEARPDLYRRFKIKLLPGEPNDFAMLQEVLTRRFSQYLRSKLEKQKAAKTALPELPGSAREEAETGYFTGEESTTDNEGFTVEVPKHLIGKMKGWKSDESFERLPDLMIIDGGKGQLSSVYEVMKQFGLDKTLPVVGLAKREEEIFKVAEQFKDVPQDIEPDEGDAEGENAVEQSGSEFKRKVAAGHVPARDILTPFNRVLLPRRSEALYLVQRIRDEAHRFAITYHRKLRSRSLISPDGSNNSSAKNS